MFNGFGKKKTNETVSSLMTPENAPTSSSSRSSVTGFDPEGLERAAKAARELDNSRNAKQAVELVKTQEMTKQHEAAAKRSQNDAYTEQMRSQNIQLEAEEARKTLDAQTQHERHRTEYQDELERKRQVDMLNAQKYMQEEQLKKQEEMVARQEAMRRKTAEHEAKLKTQTALAQAKAEADGRIRQERVNHDLILEKVRLEATEQRSTYLQGIQDGAKLLGQGMSSYLDDTEKLRNTAIMVTGVAVGVYTAKMGTGIAGRFLEARLGKPSLVRETSRFTLSQARREPLKGLKRLWGQNNSEDALKGIVLEEGLDQQLRRVAVSTANTKKNSAPFRHLLLHGPPGTGKTMFARNLAQHSGLEYAILTGGDIAPLGRDGVTELHKLFDWAQTSRKGVLLFVDEADAFLQSRETQSISEDQRNALNAFLFRTGTESRDFMMVYASNQPSQFDGAVMDRIDEMIEFDLPSLAERKKMLVMYIDQYLLDPKDGASRTVTFEGIGEEEIDWAVEETDHFSGRAISKLVIAWQAAAYGTEKAILNKDMFERTLGLHKKSMKLKEEWLVSEQARADALTTDR